MKHICFVLKWALLTICLYITSTASVNAQGGIVPPSGTIQVGCPYAFTTTTNGTFYSWHFGVGATPDSISGATMQAVTNVYFTTPGQHTVYVYVTTTCCGTVVDSVTLTVFPSPYNISLTASPVSACNGDTITFTANPASYLVYVFTVNGSVVQNGVSNSYSSATLSLGDSVMVTALQGTCFTNQSTAVFPILFPPPTLTLISSDTDSTICEGESVLFVATPIGYTNYEFFDGTTSVQSGPNITYTTTTLQAGNSITVVASNMGCTGPPSNACVTTVNTTPVITLTSSDEDNILCGGSQSVIFTASPSGYANYDFLDNGNNVQSGSNNTYTVTPTANMSLEVIATTANGCIGPTSNTIVTQVNPIPTVTLTSSDADSTVCQNVPVTFTATPSGYANYQFFNAGATAQNGTSNTYTTTLLSGNSITVVATDLGCSGIETTPIITTVIPADPVDAGNDLSACINQTVITLTPVTPANGTWEGTGTTGAGVFNPATAGAGSFPLVYLYTNSSGCTGYDTILATVHSLPVITTTPAAPALCEGNPISVTANGATTYTWSPAGGLSSTSGATVTAIPSATTTYTITGTSNSCSDSITVTVTVNPVPSVSITGTTSINACESTVLTAELDSVMSGTYSWSPPINLSCTDCQATTASPLSEQTYTVTFTSANGCSASASTTIQIVSIFNYFMPNAFTPNADGINDTLHVHGKGISSVNLQLFDRVGEKVFETTSIQQGWDGTYKGIPMNNGTYIYILNIEYCNGERIKEQGNVTLAK